MSTIIAPATVGEAFGGGHFAGLIRVAGVPHALVVAPKAAGEFTEQQWGPNRRIDGAASSFDGLQNTRAMAEAGSKIAQRALATSINDFSDWYIPSRDELEILYRGFKPTGESSWSSCGDNPSSIPVGYAYSPDDPTQTVVEAFKRDGSEAFADAPHWSSTQFAGTPSYAWAQLFSDGSQGSCHLSDEFRCRLVRRLPI